MQAKKYTLHKTVGAEHIDENAHVNNLVYLRWAQEISGKHWQDASKDMDVHEYMWVVARQEVDYLHELKQGDEIKIVTFIAEVVKHKSIRAIEFYRGEELVAKAQIFWVLLNKHSKRPVRISREMAGLFFEAE